VTRDPSRGGSALGLQKDRERASLLARESTMSERSFRKLSTWLILTVSFLTVGHLLWQHFHGGVQSHHLLHRSDLPAMSNWWALVILPFLAWFATTRIRRRIDLESGDPPTSRTIPNGILTGFIGMLIASIAQSVSFEAGHENITMYVALGVLLIGLFLPIYRAECILGHVLGATFTFGAVIPLVGILVIASVSAFSNLCIRPLLARLRVLLAGSGPRNHVDGA
jgi:hypothetical protein